MKNNVIIAHFQKEVQKTATSQITANSQSEYVDLLLKQITLILEEKARILNLVLEMNDRDAYKLAVYNMKEQGYLPLVLKNY